MLSRWLKHLNAKDFTTGYYAGVHYSLQQLHVVVLQQRATGWHLQQKLSISCPSQEQLFAAFGELSRKLPSKCRCTLVLPPERYMVLQIDKPAVPASELSLALPWAVKDLVSLPDTDLVVDYLDLPSHSLSQVAKINVVVSSKNWLKEWAVLFTQAKLQLHSIQPEEWLGRNLLAKKSHAVMLVSHQAGQEVAIQIIQNGQVSFSRRLRGFSRLDELSLEELQSGIFDNFLLELQRSIDFFEGQLKQAPVREIGLWLLGANQAQIQQLFSQNGFNQVFTLDASRFEMNLLEADFKQYSIALAGALEPVCAALEVADEIAS